MWYFNKFGKLISSDEVERAFRIVTGKMKYNNEREYISFLNSIWGKYIISVAENVTVKKLLDLDMKIQAIKQYRDENKCTLVEAKEYIDKKYFGIEK